ncbi:MAG: AMP-binding protein, partial [Desulfobacteraceae bacterium]
MRKVNYEPLSPLHFLERSAYVFPEKTAVIYNDKTFTFSQFKERVCCLATALKEKGIKKDDKVAFLCPNTPYLLEAHHAVPLLGAVLVPINIRLAPEEIAYILEDSQSKFLFIDTEFAPSIEPVVDKIKGMGVDLVNLCDVQGKAFDDAPDYEAFIDVPPEEFVFGVEDELMPITLNYTSGTTGR